MKNFKLKYILSIVVLLFSMLFSTLCAYAANGQGTGQGGGGGGEGAPGLKPLSFVSCTLEDGSKIDSEQGITLQPKFNLKFDKNVVNMLIWERNRNCFSLSTDNNVQVPITVSKIDDTVDFNRRQEIFVQPVNALEQGKTYHIKVSPDLLAKNGNSTLGGTTNGEGITISFKTKQESTSKPAVTEQNVSQSVSQNSSETKSSDQAKNSNEVKNSNEASKDSTSPDKTNTAAVQQNTPQKNNEVKNSEQTKANDTSVNADTGSEENKTAAETKGLMGKMTPTNWLTLVTVLLIIGWISIEIFIKKKKKREGSNKPQV